AVLPAQEAERGDAVGARHAEVDERDVEVLARGPGERGLGVGGGDGLVAGLADHPHHELAIVGVVVDDEAAHAVISLGATVSVKRRRAQPHQRAIREIREIPARVSAAPTADRVGKGSPSRKQPQASAAETVSWDDIPAGADATGTSAWVMRSWPPAARSPTSTTSSHIDGVGVRHACRAKGAVVSMPTRQKAPSTSQAPSVLRAARMAVTAAPETTAESKPAACQKYAPRRARPWPTTTSATPALVKSSASTFASGSASCRKIAAKVVEKTGAV